MILNYNGVDITNYLDINKAEFTDNAGGVIDSLEIIFNDPKELWDEWKPSKNDTISIKENGLYTGIMYIDELEKQRGAFMIRALSIPQKAKNSNTQAWESVRFLEFATEIATRYGFNIETYGIENYLYYRVDQYEENDFAFLAKRCLLEGYMLKIADNKVIIYNESYVENQTATTIDSRYFDGNFKFISKSNDIYSKCELSCGSLSAGYETTTAVNGAILKFSDIYFFSIGEGNRFAQNILRSKNKYEVTGRFASKLNTELAAGSNITLTDCGSFNGKYICEQTRHNFMDNGRTNFKVRKVLEGY